jgi:hypothetical protein
MSDNFNDNEGDLKKIGKEIEWNSFNNALKDFVEAVKCFSLGSNQDFYSVKTEVSEDCKKSDLSKIKLNTEAIKKCLKEKIDANKDKKNYENLGTLNNFINKDSQNNNAVDNIEKENYPSKISKSSDQDTNHVINFNEVNRKINNAINKIEQVTDTFKVKYKSALESGAMKSKNNNHEEDVVKNSTTSGDYLKHVSFFNNKI